MPRSPPLPPPPPPPASIREAAGSDDATEGIVADVRAARHGDRAAFTRLHARFAPMVHGIALARGPAVETRDIVQETFLHALDRLRLLRDDGAFGPWLASIARNLASEAMRRGRLRKHDELQDRPASEPMPPVMHEAHDRGRRLLEIIRALPEAYAETLALRLVEGLTGPQIAACTGLTHGSVRVNLTRGMSMLRERLQKMNFHVEDSP